MSKERVGNWKAGVAKANITPKTPMWLAGYGGRDHPYEGILHDVWIKVLALQDSNGRRAVIVTTDLCGIAQEMHESLCDTLKRKFGLDPSQIMVTFSHNHCAPVTRGDLVDYYPLDEEQQRRVDEYSDLLEKQIVQATGKALSGMVPADVSMGEGLCTFAVNRRNNVEAEVPGLLERGETPKGPVDHSVPVLAVRTTGGQVLAIVFGYACHNTALGFYQVCGDYAGFAQITLEKGHPGATALFFMGCGGDQNPIPRRTVELCEKYGNMLGSSVEAVLGKPMKRLPANLRTAFEFSTLNFEANPARQDLEAAVGGSNSIRARWAKRMLKRLDEGKPFAKTYPYPVQVWRLGDALLWISLGGEAVVDYALRFKKEFGPNTWVGGYAHVLVSYIPSRRVWDEGGYESTALYEYGHPADRWTKDTEDRIAATVYRLVQQVGK